MSEAQKVIAKVARKHREELEEEGVCICGWQQGAYDAEWWDYPRHLAAEIDAALGGLERQWSVCYDGGVTMRPSPGMPPQDGVERTAEWFATTGREIVIGWASGWSEL